MDDSFGEDDSSRALWALKAKGYLRPFYYPRL